MRDYSRATPAEVRLAARKGLLARQTSGMAEGFVQANLAVLPGNLAYDFLLFCTRNPKPCPLLEVGGKGDYLTRFIADGADIRTDIPKYRIYRNGTLTEEPLDLMDVWQDDFVFFLIGCSFSFETRLMAAGVPIRHIEAGSNVPMYITDVQCRPAGVFHGPLVVSMRPIPGRLVAKAVEITSALPAVHGSPVHIGDPSAIGIRDISRPDFGDPVEIKPGEIPVFWACGVTPQAAALATKPEIMITHSPGHMFVGDIEDSRIQEFIYGM
ncbi:MAG TPA: putative hydro-lyase [Bacillota bacterium]|nr:putative hydro-lyase [Bacillota bacterium]HOA14954.1 putative hydro-lyase [Bacillota bacterium]